MSTAPSTKSASSARSEAANDQDARAAISPLSKELVIGLVGYAGAGCSTTAKRLELLLSQAGYKVAKIKLSELIRKHYPSVMVPQVEGALEEGRSKLRRATALQDLGDQLRSESKEFAVAALAIREIINIRGENDPGNTKIAYIVESIKHDQEVLLLREVYGESFRLIAVHCERTTREGRLIGEEISSAKYMGATPQDVKRFMDRDENDAKNRHGQHVRDAFYLADFFINNNVVSQNGENLTADISRFVQLILGAGLVRPTLAERAMYHAHAAALQSACLSRQVGAVLVSSSGEVISTGTNEAPMFGGGVYSEGSTPDHRCHAWTWDPLGEKFVGCHNDRKKMDLRKSIGAWLGETLSAQLALLAHPEQPGVRDIASRPREDAANRIAAFFAQSPDVLDRIPGVKDLIEYSRAIHAEMDAVLSAGRAGISTQNAVLYCTTYPCHNCARHLVSAGVTEVYYIEPYVKSLATELHADSIANELPPKRSPTPQTKMVVVPFTGVGPRMYEDFFSKRIDLKGPRGIYAKPKAGLPGAAVRLRELGDVEQNAANLV